MMRKWSVVLSCISLFCVAVAASLMARPQAKESTRGLRLLTTPKRARLPFRGRASNLLFPRATRCAINS